MPDDKNAPREDDAMTKPDEQEDFAFGRADGERWAREFASPEEAAWMADGFEPGRGGNLDFASITNFFSAQEGQQVVSVGHVEGSPYWLGFIEGSEVAA